MKNFTKKKNQRQGIEPSFLKSTQTFRRKLSYQYSHWSRYIYIICRNFLTLSIGIEGHARHRFQNEPIMRPRCVGQWNNGLHTVTKGPSENDVDWPSDLPFTSQKKIFSSSGVPAPSKSTLSSRIRLSLPTSAYHTRVTMKINFH